MIGNRFSGIEHAIYKDKIGKKMGYAATGANISSIFDSNSPDSDDAASPLSPINKDSSDFRMPKGLFFQVLAPNACKEVKEAWDSASLKTGVNGKTDSSGTHLSALLALQAQQRKDTGNGDLMGTTPESAAKAVKKAISLLEHQLNNEVTNSKVRENRQNELTFYREFLKALSP